MSMSERNIAYKSIIMRCDCIKESACLEVSDKFAIVKYRPGMEAVWVEIQKAAGQFGGYSDEG